MATTTITSDASDYGNCRFLITSTSARQLRWIAATSLLLIMASNVAGFSTLIQTRAVSTRPIRTAHLRLHLPSQLRVSSTESPVDVSFDMEELRGPDGIYNIVTGDQHKAFLKENSDQLVIMKVFAPWCRACKGLEPKFLQIANEQANKDLPLKFCSMSIQNNKDYIKSIGVLALPTVQFYKNGQLVDNFPCGPSKVPILKRKLGDLIDRCVDPETNTVKMVGAQKGTDLVAEKPEGTPPVAETPEQVAAPEHEYLTAEQIQHMRTQVPFFETLTDSDFDSALQKASVLTFDAGSVIMREGNIGRTFYVILEGEVEICQRTAFEDPLIAPTDYIGTVINRLSPGDFFGERALITGEPRAASIRVTDKLRCVAFTKEDLPTSCVLNSIPATFANSTEAGVMPSSEIVERVNEKYGVSMKELDAMETNKQIKDSSFFSQKRGSAMTPHAIPGVDTDEDVVEEWDEQEDESLAMLKSKTESIVPLLEKFKLIRLISRCFDYIVASGAEWGNPAVRRRRSLLVSRLPKSQREEFAEAFHLVDTNGDGGISMAELQRIMETIGEEKSSDDLMEVIPHGYNEGADGEDIMTLQDFIGIMAEVEFYYLFRDVFASLDKRDAGFVKAGELDRVLCGVRDLISDDRHSIIDLEDKEMSIDYEQFTKMLLGLSL